MATGKIEQISDPRLFRLMTEETTQRLVQDERNDHFKSN